MVAGLPAYSFSVLQSGAEMDSDRDRAIAHRCRYRYSADTRDGWICPAAQAPRDIFEQAEAGKAWLIWNTRPVPTHRFTQAVSYRALVTYRRHISIKSITISPPVSRRRQPAGAGSHGRFRVGILNAVSFDIAAASRVRAELISMAVNAWYCHASAERRRAGALHAER